MMSNRFPLRPVQLQHRIASCVGSLYTFITEQATKLDTTLKTHKQGLMQSLFPSPEGTV